LFTHFKASYFR